MDTYLYLIKNNSNLWDFKETTKSPTKTDDIFDFFNLNQQQNTPPIFVSEEEITTLDAN